MTTDWMTVRLADAPVEIIDGDRGANYPSQTEFSPQGYCLFLNTGNVTINGFDFADCQFISQAKDEALRKGKLKRQDVVLTTRGTVGNVAYYDDSVPYDNIRINSGMVVLRPNPDKCSARFLSFFLRSQLCKEQVESLTTGSAQPQFPIKDIKRIELPLPPFAEQQRIARILGTLDDKIELNRRMNRTLEAMAAALFKSWFVDFDPVVAKAEGRQPHGMSADTAAKFPAAFQDSELGPIPQGWRIGTIGDIGLNIRRPAHPSDLAPDTPYIGLEHMPRRNITLDQWGQAHDVTSNKYQFVTGEILFGKLRPYFHKVGIAPIDGVCSTDVLVVAPQEVDWFGLLLAHLSSVDFINFVDAGSGGTRMPRTDWPTMASYKIALPSQSAAAAFTQLVYPLVAMLRSNITESRSLANARDALLPKLLSGEILVKTAEPELEQAIAG